MTGGDDQNRSVIDGRFELLQRLGGGGMGLVWRARDLMLQREVALKEVRSPDPGVHGSDPVGARVVRERVLREAQALARLQHPNVVTIYHIVDSSELAHPWLVMELVTGGSLDGLLDGRDLTVPEALRISRGVLGALRAAHAAGIQHRDVKPANVLLREDGTPVLTDFGIAALEASPGLTATGMLIGSPEYMAPERVHGLEGDPASDLWSLGLMLYVGLEGHNPLSRETTIATIAAVSEGHVPPPVRSGAMSPILSALLVPEPYRRPTAEQLDAMLAQVEAGQHVTGFQTPPPGPRLSQLSQMARTGEMGLPGRKATTDQIPGQRRDHAPGWMPPPINPYGYRPLPAYDMGTGPQEAARYRAKAFRLSAAATVGTLAIMGVAVWASTHAQTHAGTSQDAHGPLVTSSSASTDQSIPTNTSQSAAPVIATSAATSSPDSTATTTQHLLTPAGVRYVIKQILAVSGGTKVVSMTVYDDHASFDVVKKDDPGVYDTYSYIDGKAGFSMTGETLDQGEPALDPYTVDWDALPALLADANKTPNVKSPTMHYVIVDSDIIDHTLGLRVYLADTYRSGHLNADLKGKILERYPQE